MTDIAAAAPPNHLTPAELRPAPGETVTPARAGWRFLSFRVVTLAGDESLVLDASQEAVVVPIVGAGVVIEVADREPLQVAGRVTPFDALPSAAYLPASFGGALRPMRGPSASPATIAVGQAPPSGREGASREPILIGPEQVAVEVRGSGNATRQVNHIITPEFPADRLLVVEVLTPSGNWSSWPPHKHDTDDMPREAVLEEIYHYRFRRPEGWGIQRLYRRDGSRDALWAVRDGEVVLVTDGYHPFVATHGDDAYYLNILAGDRRTMACSFDPDLDFVRGEWATTAPDSRVPLVR